MKPKAHWKPLIASFEAEVHDRAKAVDPDDELDWHDLTVGWALGKGLKPADARALATYIRCYTALG